MPQHSYHEPELFNRRYHSSDGGGHIGAALPVGPTRYRARFLVAGIVVGPSALSLIDNRAEIGQLAELGVVLLLFVIGIELKPSRLWLMRRQVFGLGALQVVVTGGLISAVAYFVFGVDLRSAVLIGPALALSSTAFVLQLLSEQKMLTSNYGRTSIAVLLFQDLAVVPLLALASLLAVAPVTVEKDIGLALIEALIILALVIFGGPLSASTHTPSHSPPGITRDIHSLGSIAGSGNRRLDGANRSVHGHGCVCGRTADR